MKSTTLRRTERDSRMELLRILLMYMIAFVHTIGLGGLLNGAAPFSKTYFALWWLEGMGCVSTNAFVILSGYYMIHSRLTAKKVVRLWMQVFFYAVGCYLVMSLLGKRPITWDAIRVYLFPIVNEKYWFITGYMGVFLLSPALNAMIDAMDRKAHFLLVVTLLILFSVLPCLFGRLNVMGITDGYGLTWMLVLYILGAYLRKYPVWEKGRVFPCLLIWVLCAAVYPVSRFIVHALVEAGHAKTSDLGWLCMRNSIFCLIGSVSLFMAFRRLRELPAKLGKFVCRVSPMVFGVYLLHTHPYVGNALWKRLNLSQYLHTPTIWLVIPLVALAILLAGLLVDSLRQLLFRPLEESAGFDRFCSALGRLFRLEWLYRLLEPKQ